MKRTWVTYTAALFILFSSGPPLMAAPDKNVCQGAGAENSYAVFRKNKQIGTHTICFWPKGDDLRVVAVTDMKVKFLFVTAYRYHYESEEHWHSGRLVSVETRVNDNGKEKETRLDEPTLADIVTTNHWNIHATQQTALYNTITGTMNNVSVAKQSVSDGQKDIEEYAVRGSLNINTFYDTAGNWQGMSFRHKDGSLIEFRCLSCDATPSVALETAR